MRDGILAGCGTCGAELTAAAKFCAACGTATSAAPASSRVAADRSPRDYTPKHLADRILQSKSTLEGERKQVTFPFADAKGSVELAEDLDPEQWHRILARFFAMLA